MIYQRVCVATVVLIGGFAFGQDDDEQKPGLHARYQTGDAVVERVDPDIAFVWSDAAPDERIPHGKFTASWSGTLLLRSEDKYRFHAFVQGRVELKVNQQVVLTGEAEQPRWISGPETALTFGDQPFELTFVRTGDAAQLKLYWSCTEFPIEPVPYHSLFQSKASPELELIERGRVQFEAFRCANCHAMFAEGKLANVVDSVVAPSLKHVGIGTSREWMLQRLMASGDPKVTGKMPHFGLEREDAEAVVESLLSKAVPVELAPIGELKESEREKSLQAGRGLVRSIGCLACHTWDGQGEETLLAAVH